MSQTPPAKRRVVSLLPAGTEIVCALGCGEQLVGRSHECDFPAAVRQLPACTMPRFSRSGSSAEIDQQVKTALSAEESLYEIDQVKLKALGPDFILTQAQCEACAVSLTEVERMIGEWTGARPQILSLSPRTLAEVWDAIHRV